MREQLPPLNNDLQDKKTTIQQQVDDEPHYGKMPTQEVKRWFTKVEDKLAHARHVEDKVSKGKCLFHSCLGKLVDETTQALKEIHAEGYFSGRLVVNDPSLVAVKLPTQTLVGHQVRVRDEIYGYLMGGKVGMIGVCRMGGIGKMTIMRDVHNNFDLGEIGIDELTKDNRCKVVLTTRSEEVIRSMGCKKVQVACLSKHEVMNLFLSKVRQDVSANPTLKSSIKLLVRECDRLPLALVTLAASMKGISNPRVWENAVNELRSDIHIRNIQGMKDKVFRSLKYSCDRLEKVDQDCFFYCALYPKGHQFEKEEIIQYWIEEGLIAEMGSQKAMEDNSHSILEKFEQNYLLERVKNGACVKMHDVVRKMALNITTKRFMVKAGKQLKELSNEEEWGEGSEKSLPSSISALEELKVLLLNRCNNLESLPSVLKLQALKKLRLGGSGIKEIPQGLEMLVNLRYFDLLAKHLILRNPEQMSEFNKLEVFEGWFYNMGDWNMYVGQRKKLYKYSILVCPLYPSRDIPWASSNLVVFERIEINSGDAVMLPYDIQQLHLKHCYGARSLNDIRLRDAIDLKECTVEDCFDLESIFSSKNDQLKKLKSLTLRNLADLKVLVGVGVGVEVLHKLEKVEVNGCLELEEIITEPEEEGMVMVCNSLQVIEISNCPKVKRIPLLLPQLKVDGEGKLYPSNTLQEIRMQTEDWWESVEGKHPSLNVKNVVQPLLNPYGLVWSVAVGPSSAIHTVFSDENPDACVIM
ncbi:hypothetical protein CXB51_029800 [Gossypium anomalum]|uniref:NB-ARC domain-containing protein n=1 Tax=Gossypium anomalum TaxID=47600 RepID=A0A8J6CR49_9ROSI|nr:hypothetical protein CXB51_029800 [Gossypium anomalum]